MTTSRRDFIKKVGQGAAATGSIALLSNDLVQDLLAQTPAGNVRASKFKGLSDIVLSEAKNGGCTYADVRFTMTLNPPGGTATFNVAGTGRGGGGGGGRGGGGGGGGGRGGRGGGANAFKGFPTDAEREAAGFGVRVVHSGVWGFASSPIVMP